MFYWERREISVNKSNIRHLPLVFEYLDIVVRFFWIRFSGFVSKDCPDSLSRWIVRVTSVSFATVA